MIETLISSKTRIKLLKKFFINANTTGYLRSLQQEFGESSNAIRVELNRLEEAGMLNAELIGNKKVFRANAEHPLFEEVHRILLKQIGLNSIIEQVIERLGNVEKVFLIGDFSRGTDSPIIDLLIFGEIDRSYLLELIEKAEKAVHRKIRFLLYPSEKASAAVLAQFHPSPLLLWSKDKEA